uniref:Uncharacterized protein n=1 Tax=Abalone asfa-like virus TaxID=2839893 RepID=A0A5K7XZ60_9VIRU|nr:hypothetical protein [Abalone asfa-like virus]BCY04537.1 hypothetical protein [Abalone asfa-like virus]
MSSFVTLVIIFIVVVIVVIFCRLLVKCAVSINTLPVNPNQGIHEGRRGGISYIPPLSSHENDLTAPPPVYNTLPSCIDLLSAPPPAYEECVVKIDSKES